jgi:hypothetical protein
MLGAGDEVKSRTTSGFWESGNHSISLRPIWQLNDGAVNCEETAFDRVKYLFRETARGNELWRLWGSGFAEWQYIVVEVERAGGRR